MARFVSHTITAPRKTPRKTGVTGGFVRHCCCLASCLLGIAASTVLCRAEEEKTAPPKQPMSVVTILSDDNQGNALRFPSAVAFDSEQEEIYVIKGGNKMGFVIYDSDFIPHLFLGAGRGIDTPQSIFFDSKGGNLFVCQGKSATHPPRLTILNGAFFPIKEIIFDHIPEAENFSPFRGTLGKTGNIYLVDNNIHGVLVLDKDGNFLRWLRPMDSIRRQVERKPQEKEPQGKNEAIETPPSEPPLETDLLGLPPELVPKARLKPAESADGPKQGPVMINDIITDSDGHLFLLSEETSKVYVYAVNENFLFSFGEKGGSTGKMSRPRGIAINEGRKIIYIVDYMRHTILVYDLAGKYLFEFGGRGSGPLWFNFPNSITIDRKGRLIVADLFNNRVQILKTEFDMTFSGSKGLKTDTPATVTPGVPQTFTPTTIMPGTPQTLTPTAVTPSTQQAFPPTTATTSAPQTITPTPKASAPPNNVEVETGTTSDRHIEDWR